MDLAFFKSVLDSIADGVYFTDLDRKVSFWNKAAERLTGYASEEVLGRSCADNLLRHVDDLGTELCLTGCPLAETMQDGRNREMNVYLHHKFGHRVPVKVRSSPMRDEQGKIIGAVEVFTDNSSNINVLRELEKLRQEVLTDQLTGIGNRRYADITMDSLDRTMQENGVPFGILMADIDHFKKVNDTFGHQVGDLVLKMVAKTMTSIMRPLDAACRWGGEEFILLIPNVSGEALENIANRLRVLVENSWLDHEEGQLRVTVSFGGAVSEPNEKAVDVAGRADGQLYLSKEAGRNCVFIDRKAFVKARS